LGRSIDCARDKKTAPPALREGSRGEALFYYSPRSGAGGGGGGGGGAGQVAFAEMTDPSEHVWVAGGGGGRGGGGGGGAALAPPNVPRMMKE